MADSPTYLTWNLPNWITVVIMVGLGVILLGFIASAIGQITGNTADA